jgi:hypothetical protein
MAAASAGAEASQGDHALFHTDSLLRLSPFVEGMCVELWQMSLRTPRRNRFVPGHASSPAEFGHLILASSLQLQAVLRRSDMIGFVSLMRPDFLSRHAYLGFMLDAEAASAVMAETVRLACSEALSAWDFGRIFLEIDERSLPLLEESFGPEELETHGVLKGHFFDGGHFRNLAIVSLMNISPA